MIELRNLQKEIHDTAKEKGWYDQSRSIGELIALCHSELSEALEAARNGNTPDKHCPEFSGVEVELADCIIRILDMAESQEFDVIGAMLAKIEYNKSRPYKHGGKKF